MHAGSWGIRYNDVSPTVSSYEIPIKHLSNISHVEIGIVISIELSIHNGILDRFRDLFNTYHFGALISEIQSDAANAAIEVI